jgi:hypothetical protein
VEYLGEKMRKKIFIVMFILVIVLGSTVLVSQSKANGRSRAWIGGGLLLNQFTHQYAFGSGYFGARPYWHSPQYLFRSYPYGRGYYYGYPYYFRYREERSPYQNLEIKKAGELMIKVKPQQVEVMVDGYQLKPREDFSYTIGLLTGTHQVEVKAKGYKPYFADVKIQAAKRTSVSITLERENK